MPNWTRNEVRFIDKTEDEIKALPIFTEKEGWDGEKRLEFDFEKLIPMPDYIFRGNLGSEEREKYGENNWYDWSYKNWGVKWNACDTEFDNDTVIFFTPWSAPRPIIKKLCELGKDFEWKWFNEDEGGGEAKWVDGELNAKVFRYEYL